MNSKWIVLIIVLLLGSSLGYYFYTQGVDEDAQQEIKTVVNKGDFQVMVLATGELQAKRSEKILGPQGMRSAGIFQTNIQDIVPEGTIVTEGGFVATLDRTEVGNKMKTVGNDIEKSESQLLQTKLDTAIEMRQLRDQLVNLKFSIEEKKLEVQQNVYEPPAVQRQTQIALEKIQRDLLQAKENYSLKKEQAEARVQELMATLEQHTDNLDNLTKLSQGFTVKAPKSGMVIYDRSWNGKKGPGSRISAWDPVVARLPDLTEMISLTYVNEVDISKVQVDQAVTIRVDAFPENSYTGKILSVANIGEQRPNFDAKVFEVKIQLLESDSILRPAMTTSNEVLTQTIKDQIFIPLESLFSNDSLLYVFKSSEGKITKQEVITGVSNDNEIIIKHGLNEGEEILISSPENEEQIEITFLPKEIREEYERKKREAAERKKAEALAQQKKLEEAMKDIKVKPGENFTIIKK